MGRDHLWIVPAIVIAAVAAISAYSVKLVTGYPAQPSGLISLSAAILISLMVALARFLRYLLAMWRAGEERPTIRIQAAAWPAAASFAPVAIGIAVMSVFLYSITFLKSMMPALIPFWADLMFAATDHALRINSEAMAMAIKPALYSLAIFYGFWQFVHFGGILWVLHWRNGAKARHILGFLLTWSIGTIIAYAFSSAGPLFTGQYDPEIAPEMIRRTTAFLWANYQADGALLGAGISAFPSMHVAIAVWFAIVLRDRGWPKIGLFYATGVFVCSVVLGWHYVVDGVAGAVIAIIADRLAEGWLRRSIVSEAASQTPCVQP